MVVAAATGKRKWAGVGRSLVGRLTKRVQGLFVGDTTDETNSSPEWCREDDLLPARVQQARRCGRVIRSHPDHTLLGDDRCGPYVRAGVEECFVAQAPACVRCTSLRTLTGSAAITLQTSLPRNLGGLVALPRGRTPMVARGAGAFGKFTCFPNPLFFSSENLLYNFLSSYISWLYTANW